ncbi:hypothetical protein ACTQ1U_04355 [Thermoguttaceae bacterium LCP21S3_D4]
MNQSMNKLAIFFPGIGYHCDKPLLYYSRKLAGETGYETILTLDYSLSGSNITGNIRGDKEKMQQAFSYLYEQAAKQLSSVNWSEYDEILFVSKSIGTIIASAYAQNEHISCRQILYTPLCETYDFHPQNAIAFIGTSDPWSNIEKVTGISREQKIPLFLYPDANHSLETKDTLGNIKTLRNVMEETKHFLTS